MVSLQRVGSYGADILTLLGYRKQQPAVQRLCVCIDDQQWGLKRTLNLLTHFCGRTDEREETSCRLTRPFIISRNLDLCGKLECHTMSQSIYVYVTRLLPVLLLPHPPR